jgi:DNA-binding winged helix-turn-helix (wHTH) protein
MQIRFGLFSLDTDRRLLLHGDEPRHLSPKGLELLQLLVASRPRALSKAELHERLWPSVFVSEATLSSLVAEVRSALGESAHSGGFVRTVHRYGYAFNGEAVESGAQLRTSANRTKCWIIWEFGQVALSQGEHLLGRAGDVAVWLESPTISRHHAKIVVTDEHATIEDLASKNGTFRRSERIASPVVLADGDELRLGSVAVTFRITGAAGSTVTRTTNPEFS